MGQILQERGDNPEKLHPEEKEAAFLYWHIYAKSKSLSDSPPMSSKNPDPPKSQVVKLVTLFALPKSTTKAHRYHI